MLPSDLPQTAEVIGFSLHLVWQPASIHESIVHAWVLVYRVFSRLLVLSIFAFLFNHTKFLTDLRES
jgi:hypothetical protein